MARKAGVGYQRRDPVSHRKYNMARSLAAFKRTGNFRYVKDGSGHRAGENWGNAKDIDPYSPQKKYSKNSPSFDEGVWWSKQKRKVTDMAQKMSRGEKTTGSTKFIPQD